MNNEEAIAELSYIADEMPSMECADWKEAICIAIKALEQEPKWIPVSERLPEENGRYLVYLNTKVFPIRILEFAKNLNEISLDFNYSLKSKKTGWYDYDSENGFFEWTGVEAWMPLPEEPYKIESEG
jgi:hypothetical protein